MEPTSDRRSVWRRSSARRWLLRTLLGSVIINAALALWALLVGDFGQTEGKILVTSLLTTAAMTSALVNSIPMARRLLRPVPAAGAAAAVAGFGMLIVLLWAETDSETPFKLVGTVLTFAAAATVAGLLELVELAPRFEPVRMANHALLAVLVVTVWWGIWRTVDGDWYGRIVGVESVLAAATTLAIPLLSRFEPLAPASGGRSVGTDASRPSMSETTIGALVTRPAVVIGPTTTLRDTIDRMADHGADLAVIQDSHSVSGVITATDLLRAMHDGAEVDEVWAADVMSVQPLIIDADTSVERAARLLGETGVRELLVLNDDLRVVSTTDVLRELLSTRLPESRR